MIYFFDTYALIELMKNSPSYERFGDFRIITSVLNVGELYNILLREGGKKRSDEWFENINFKLLELSVDVIRDSVYFRFINKEKNISLTDAVGYVLSLKYKIKFLTGDRQFKDMPNVEFVK